MKLNTLQISAILCAAIAVAMCFIEGDITEAITWALIIFWTVTNAAKSKYIQDLETYIAILLKAQEKLDKDLKEYAEKLECPH